MYNYKFHLPNVKDKTSLPNYELVLNKYLDVNTVNSRKFHRTVLSHQKNFTNQNDIKKAHYQIDMHLSTEPHTLCLCMYFFIKNELSVYSIYTWDALCMAKKCHPDTSKVDPEAAKKFQEVTNAYEVLSNDKKRKQYDQFGTTADFGSAGTTGFHNFQSSIDPDKLF
ncbi:uncharacterized protein LOC143255956 isoform X1 [Tachypleus tridentatus]|uniref:uncharacterized protein LOC143255956 isoform X1 n=1 Tax=Tachypleus tridentatus TaxID=6853 RepID=UPI003FD1567E